MTKTLKTSTLLVCFLSLSVLRPGAVRAIGTSISAGYEYVPYSGFKNPPAGTVLQQAEVNQTKIYANAVFPFLILRNGKTILVNSVYADRFSLGGRNFGSSPSNTDNLVGMDYSFMWIEILNKGWKSMVTIKPGLYYDGYDTSRNIFRLQGMASFWKTLNAHMEAGLGGGYIDDFGNPKPVPFFGLKMNWSPTGEHPKPGTHVIDLVLPVSASYFYVASEKIQIGAVGQVAGGKYRLTQGSSTSGDSVEFSVQTFGPSIRFTPNNRWAINLSGGAATNRLFQIRDSNNNLVSDFNLKNSTFARLEAKVNF